MLCGNLGARLCAVLNLPPSCLLSVCLPASSRLAVSCARPTGRLARLKRASHKEDLASAQTVHSVCGLSPRSLPLPRAPSLVVFLLASLPARFGQKQSKQLAVTINQSHRQEALSLFLGTRPGAPLKRVAPLLPVTPPFAGPRSTCPSSFSLARFKPCSNFR